MTFNEFKYLNEVDQEYLLWRSGVELARKKNGIFHYILYQVDGFYMEVKYTMPKRTIIHIACFEDLEYIETYLQAIDINSLFAA